MTRVGGSLPVDVGLALFIGNDSAQWPVILLAARWRICLICILAVIGNGAHVPSFRQRAAELGAAARAFPGALKSDTGPAYQAADLLVHPTTEDTYAMTVWKRWRMACRWW